MTITDDNSTWMHGSLTSRISGEYTIDENSVKRLMSIMTDSGIMRIYEKYGMIGNQNYEIITGDKNIIEKIQDLETTIKVMRNEEKARVQKEMNYLTKWNNLKNSIDDFNSTRRWYERKFELPEDNK